MGDNNGLTSLTSHKNEFVKQFIELDGDRVSKVFTAHVNAEVGSECMVTAYAYAAPSSTTIIARVEGSSTWLQAYEDALPSI